MLCRMIIISVDASSFLCNFFFDLVVSSVAAFDALWIMMEVAAEVVKDIPS